jgi:hypothetical protein
MAIALVVHETSSGRDRRIAQRVADGLSARMPAYALPAVRAPRRLGMEVGLVVVGGPERDHGSEGDGLHAWLTDLSATGPGIPAAAWHSRTDRLAAGDGGHSEERLLWLRGFDLVAPAEQFPAAGEPGPPEDDELDRARRWGAGLGELVGGRARLLAGT